MRRALYIETVVRADLDAIWQATQDPRAHQRWDLRFTTIEWSSEVSRPAAGAAARPPGGAAAGVEGGRPTAGGAGAGAEYLPAAGAAAAGDLPDHPPATRRFRYATRVLPWLTVSGHGTCAGERRRPDGSRVSALRFSSAHPLSLIATGAGYWRYVPTAHGVRFLTGYDYGHRWGAAGRAADLVFRPLMGWATAWSFDRLRLWLEHGVTPERALRWALFDAGGRAVMALGALAVLPAPLAVLVAMVAALAPPLPRTPAARRCRRRAPDRLGATPPSRLAHLEHP